jgi:hypothetical protein
MRKLTALATLTGALLLATASPAAAAPGLEVTSFQRPTPVAAGTYSYHRLTVSNPGDATITADPVEIEFTVPAGAEVASVTAPEIGPLTPWTCTTPDSQTAHCEGPNGAPLRPGPGEDACEAVGECPIVVLVKTDEATAPGTEISPEISACGGGASACPTPAFQTTDPFTVGPLPAFGLTAFDGIVLDSLGDAETRAGSHPHTASTEFFLSTYVGQAAIENPIGQLRDAAAKLPPGLVGDPTAVDTCTQAQLRGTGTDPTCPPESQVGTVTLWFSPINAPGPPKPNTRPVFNMQTPEGTEASPIGTPALFGFNYLAVLIQVYGKVRSGDDYGVTVLSKNAAQTLSLAGVGFEFWGVPASASHNADRRGGDCPSGCASADLADPKPFISLPTSCTGPVDTTLDVLSWLDNTDSATFTSHDTEDPPNPVGATGCESVPFAPTITARPTTDTADSPSGLDFEIEVPQDQDPDGIATAHLKDVTVSLPEGVAVNPAAAAARRSSATRTPTQRA